MANRRMFSLSVIDTDAFLDMPLSSRLLYYELGMRADDDGFVGSWKKIVRASGLSEDDMKVLIAKKFVIPFQSGVIVIRHWRLNNYLRNDRYVPTIYRKEMSELECENGIYKKIDDSHETLDTADVGSVYTNGIPDCIPTVYTDKYSIDKNNTIVQNSLDESSTLATKKSNNTDLVENFDKIWNEYPRKEGKSDAFRHYKSWLNGKEYAGKKIKLTNKQMWYAVVEYASLVEQENKEKRYIKMGSSFFNSTIMDYVKPEEELDSS